MRALVVVLALLGAHYGATALWWGWSGLGLRRRSGRSRLRLRIDDWLRQAGLAEVRPTHFAAASMATAAISTAATTAVYGPVVGCVGGVIGAATPLVVHHQRRRARIERARDSWPAIIEEIRVRCGPAGLSLPQALLSAGRAAPVELREAFVVAERTWRLTTDFEATVAELRRELADHTADLVLETVLVAHDAGGPLVTDRLEALAADRAADLAHRKEAAARLAGARFARFFVLLVPIGMTAVGLSLGTGRAAYTSGPGPALVIGALVLTGLCWLWAGHLMRLPASPRVFVR